MVNNRKKKNANRNRAAKASLPATTNGPKSQRTGPKPKNKPVRRNNRMRGTRVKVSDAGLGFLKCAFAAPDFSVDPGKGIPDSFQGRTLPIKDCGTQAIDFTAGKDTYIVIAPVPGYAYFKCEVDIGANPTDFVGVVYPTYSTNFGNGNSANFNYSAFRYAALAAGIYPTSNYMNFAGSISVWKIDLTLSSKNVRGSADGTNNSDYLSLTCNGLNGLVTIAPRDNYTESYIKGAFAYGYDRSGNFEWNEFRGAAWYANNGTSTDSTETTPAGRNLQWDGSNYLPGLGNTNTLVFKISTPTGATNSAILKSWCCLEMQPNTDSSIFQFSGMSPAHDAVAMAIYNQQKLQHPVAVPVAQNSGMWESVLRSLDQFFKWGTNIPGPYGVISGGLSGITTGLSSLLL